MGTSENVTTVLLCVPSKVFNRVFLELLKVAADEKLRDYIANDSEDQEEATDVQKHRLCRILMSHWTDNKKLWKRSEQLSIDIQVRWLKHPEASTKSHDQTSSVMEPARQKEKGIPKGFWRGGYQEGH